MSITGYDHVQLAVPARSEDDLRAFYGDLLGMTEVPKPSALAGRGGCWFRAGTAVVHLGVEEPFAPARKAHPAFAVADLDALQARLEAAGYACARTDGEIPGVVPALDADGGRPPTRWREVLHTHDVVGNRIEFSAAS